MVITESICADCEAVGLWCLGEACEYFRGASVTVCDRCGVEIEASADSLGNYADLCDDCANIVKKRQPRER